MKNIRKIVISEDFSDTPGARVYEDGDFSGQEFYEKLLRPDFEIARKERNSLLVDFDDCYGFASSFISGSFGRLSKEFGANEVLKVLIFKSEDEPLLIDQVISIIKNPNIRIV